MYATTQIRAIAVLINSHNSSVINYFRDFAHNDTFFAHKVRVSFQQQFVKNCQSGQAQDKLNIYRKFNSI